MRGGAVTPQTMPEVYLIGWAWGHEVQNSGQWRSDWVRPAFRIGVLSPVLRCMSTFPESEVSK